jgi:hypothetical protein
MYVDDESLCYYYVVYNQWYACDELAQYYIDCSELAACGGYDETGFTCTDGSVVDGPEDCLVCAYDWTNYGAADCDAAFDAYGLTCDQLEANYNWDCTGCECPEAPEGCTDGQFDCNGDGSECIPGSYYCDGSVDNGNAGWPADCSNGADENLEECCEAGTAAYGEAVCGGGSDCEGLTVSMADAYGDGWTGNQ